MRRLIVSLALTALLWTPTAGALAQTMPVPAPRPVTGCTPKRDSFFPAVIGIGATCNGMLITTAVDLVTHQRGDIWLFDGYQGTCVEITMRSTQIDAYLETGPWVGTWYFPVLARDDDGGGWTDARVRVPIRQNGSYYILASGSPTSLDTQAGSYALSLAQVPC